jgi:uncharacterized protein YbbC (DUF1343 family)
MAESMNALKIEGIIFRPITFKPFYGRDANKTLHGVQIHFTDFEKLNLMSLQYLFMQEHHKLYPDKNPFEMNPKRWGMFDKVSGTSKVREMFSKNFLYSDIKNFLEKDIVKFRKLSEKYYLYR